MFSIGNVVKFQFGSSTDWIVAEVEPNEFLYLVSLNLDSRTTHVHSARVEFLAHNVAEHVESLFNRKVETS